MIDKFSDHAANERTFLAWLRTGLAIAAFGFVIEKFNLFLAIAASAADTKIEMPKGLIARAFAPIGRYDGIVLIAVGITIMIVGGVRFVRTAHEIDRPEIRPAAGARSELLLVGALAFLAAAFCIYLALR